MSLEVNKIAAAVLLAGIIGMVVGKVTDTLYHPEQPEERGYTIEVAETSGGSAAVKDQGPVDILAFLSAADTAKGEKIFKTKCTTCHTGEQGGANKQGPNLWSIVGTAKGSKSGFSYSPAMQEKGGNWGFQELSEFFTKPAKYVKGTRMAFAGLKNPADRASLISYLNSLGSNKPVPVYVPPLEEESSATPEAAEGLPPAELP